MCASGNISERVTWREEGTEGPAPVSPPPQMTADSKVRRLVGKSNSGLAGPGMFFITERDPLKALLCHKRRLFFVPLGNSYSKH